MFLMFRTVVVAGALALSTAAFAGNDEGNKPLNNVAVTAPPMYSPDEHRAAAENEPTQMPAKHRYRHHRMSGNNTSGMGSSTSPQGNY